MRSPDTAGMAVLTEGLTKRFGKVHALNGLDLAAPRGTVLGLLGPNGAGKSTAVRILATLARPDGGRALVAGHDVVREAHAVRRLIALTGQHTALDETLTGRENLRLIGGLFHLGAAETRRRTAELLDLLDLHEAADRTVRTYSGGMRRRLDVGASLVGQPRVVFLDEPTAGLDPRSRQALWDLVRRMAASGTTVVLTTQYLEEADQLAGHVAVIDHGRVLAEGTPAQLKERVGGDVVELRLADPEALPNALDATARMGAAAPHTAQQRDDASGELALPAGGDGAGVLVAAVRGLDGAGVGLAGATLRRPSLDDAFLALTGHRASTADTEDAEDEEAHR